MDRSTTRAWQRTVGSCRVCDQSGHLRKGGRLEECECNRLYKSYLQYSNAGIPSIYWEKDWTDYTAPDRDSFDLCKDYVRRIREMYAKGVGLYLWGDFGVGKTGLAVEIMKDVMRLGDYTVAFLFFPDVMNSLTAFDVVSPEDRGKVVSTLEDADFLVLDDVGREYRKEGSNWVSSNVDQYFRKRMNASLPTLMTSNFSLSKIREFYGESLSSVFRGSLVELSVDGRDFREVEGERKRELLEGFGG